MPKQQCECGARFKFAQEHLGKRAECKKCGEILTLTGEEDLEPIPFADDGPEANDISAEAEGLHAPPLMSLQGQIVAPPGSPAVAAEGGASVQPPASTTAFAARSYGSNVLWTFLFPGSSAGNLITFTVIWGVMALAPLLSWFPFIGWIAGLFVAAWYYAFRFAILLSAAAGESDLPDVSFSREYVEELLVPFFKWVGSWIVVFMPALAYLLVAWQQGSLTGSEVLDMLGGGTQGLWQGTSASVGVFAVLVCLGIALWPVVVLCVALGGFEALYRVDLIALTIVKTLPAYILTLALMFGAIMLLKVLGTGTAVSAVSRTPGAAGGAIGGSMLAHILSAGLSVYLDIVLMRLIGLYYHHFKHRFAYDWG